MNPGIRLPDFDALMALHQDDPDRFEEFRKRLLREAVEQAPTTHRPALDRLLSRIETARDAAATPMEAAVAASRMMADSVDQLHRAWQQAQHAVAGWQAATIIERFRR
jgi:ABC-type transporter Mla subunit MlaD